MAADGVARRPHIVCRDSAASREHTRHGVYHVKTLADGARSIVVPEMPAGSDGSGPGEYATILKAAGAHQYTAEGNYFRRHGDVFMFHTAGTDGALNITFPAGVAKVRELYSGQEFTLSNSKLAVESDGPGTWVFKAVPLVTKRPRVMFSVD